MREGVARCSETDTPRTVPAEDRMDAGGCGHLSFTEDRKEWNQELHRHCEGVSTDPEETKKVQKGRIEYFKRKGDQHFTDDGRRAEITIDLVLQDRAKKDV